MAAIETTIPVEVVTTKPEGMGSIAVYSGDFDDTKEHWATAAMRGQINLEATYYAPMDENGYVLRAYVREVERLHPGMLYVYL